MEVTIGVGRAEMSASALGELPGRYTGLPDDRGTHR